MLLVATFSSFAAESVVSVVLDDTSLLASLSLVSPDASNVEVKVKWILPSLSCAVLLFDGPTNLLGPLAIHINLKSVQTYL